MALGLDAAQTRFGTALSLAAAQDTRRVPKTKSIKLLVGVGEGGADEAGAVVLPSLSGSE